MIQSPLQSHVNTIALGPADRQAMLVHLQTLSSEDRRRNFGTWMTDVALRKYVEDIVFAQARCFGVRSDDGALVGLARLSINAEGVYGELAVSVLHAHRGHGAGRALLHAALNAAWMLGVRTIYVPCMSESNEMKHLAAAFGVDVVLADDATTAGGVAPAAHTPGNMVLIDSAVRRARFAAIGKLP